ncbi:hypothetical protein, partial [Parabacteroides goldsteinii]
MPDGIYFLGKKGGFCYSYAEKKIFKCPEKGQLPDLLPNYAFLYNKEDRKVLFSSLGSGLWWYYPDTGEIEQVSFIQEKNISSMYLDSQQRIWVAVYNKGVYCYSYDGEL